MTEKELRPVRADIGMIFLNDVGPMEDKNVRQAAAFAIDKKAIVERLLRPAVEGEAFGGQPAEIERLQAGLGRRGGDPVRHAWNRTAHLSDPRRPGRSSSLRYLFCPGGDDGRRWRIDEESPLGFGMKRPSN